jgi:hypothetical protein
MLAHECQGFPAPAARVGHLTHFPVLLVLQDVLRRMQPYHPDTGRIRAIPHAQLGAAIAANGKHLMEHPVIAHFPRRDCRRKNQGGNNGGQKPRLLVPGQPVTSPSPGKRQER